MSENKTTEEFGISDEQVADMVLGAIPKVISFIIVLAGGFLLLMPLETHFETWLLKYISSKLAVTLILLAVEFGPLTYFEERIEQVISRILAKVMKKQLEEGKQKALEHLKKKELEKIAK